MSPLRILLALLFAAGGGLPAAERLFTFDDATLNQPPPGFQAILVGQGGPGDWRVVEDQVEGTIPSLSGRSDRRATQRVLTQTSRDTTDERFPILAYTGDTYADFTLSARVRMVDGEKEQMAGLVFRMVDESNFYYVRASALGGTLYFIKVVNGVRSPPIGVKMGISKGVWHSLAVECRGNHIRVLWNGREAIPQMTDKSFVFGKIGVWTKSDSVSQFTDLKINYTPREIFAQTLVREAMEKYDRLENLMVFSTGATNPALKVIAAARPEDLDRPAGDVESDVLKRSKVYHSKITQTVTMTLPLHDANGETIAAVRLVMKSFPGETEKTAITRAVPVIQMMERRVRNQADLLN